MTGPLREELDRLGLPDLYEAFARNDIDCATLDELTEDDLREIGLTLGQRKRFLRALRGATAETAGSAIGARPHSEALPSAERRQLTTLFSDLVGSTRLATVLDPEDLRDIIESYQALCASVVRSHAGYVAFSAGDGLMAYFGFPFAHEDDPERAVRAAFDIREKLADLQHLAPLPLQVRVGIATGLVVVGDSRDPSVAGGNVVGETPNLAARLQEAARPGEIVISESTRRLCGALFAYEPRGDLLLKGFPGPVTVHCVVGEGPARSRFEARASAGLNPIVGRDAELERLRAAWRAALGGAGQVVLVHGEAGIGKSRLARALIEMIAPEQPRILQWHCAAHLANRPLHPMVREIETAPGLARTLPATVRRGGLDKLVTGSALLRPEDAPFLADLLGIAGPAQPKLDAQARARRTMDVLARRVEGMAQDAPLLILLEDAHWADAATLDFLDVLVERAELLPVLLLVTHRPEFVPGGALPARGVSIALDTLDQAAGARLVDMVVRERSLPTAVVRTIIEKAGGVPLFVEELTRAVLDAILDPGRAATSLAGLSIPETLHDSLMARLDQLGTAKDLAQVGSVIGREFTSSMLHAVGPEHADLAGDLRKLCESGLADEGGPQEARVITFHHALVQDTAYASLLRRRRRDIHRAIAEAMLAGHPAFTGVEPETIARHCTHGGLPEPAVEHWLIAGLQALDRAAPAPAISHLRAALEQLALLPEDERRVATELRIQMALAPATMAIQGWAAREVELACQRACDLAAQVGNGEALCGATWGLWTNFFLRGEMHPALETARRVKIMAEETGSQVLALAAAHALSYSHYSRGEYREAAAAAAEGAARSDPEAERAALRSFQLSPTLALPTIMANVHWFLGEDAAAETAMLRAHAAAEALRHPPALVQCLCVSTYWLLFADRLAQLRPHLERALCISVEEGFRFWEPMARIPLCYVEAEEGDLDGAIRRAIEAIQAYEMTGATLVMSQYEPRLSELLIRAGDPETALRRLSNTITGAERRAERTYLPELYRVRALARCALGQATAAAQDAAAAHRIAAAQQAVPLIRRTQATLGAIARTTNMPASPDAGSRRGLV